MGEYKTIRSLTRGLSVLAALNSVRTLTVAQLSRSTKLPRATVSRLLETLVADGYVYQAVGSNSFSLRKTIKNLGSNYDRPEAVVEAAGPLVHDLGRAVQWPIDLFIPMGGQLVLRQTTHSSSPKTFFPDTKLGYTVPFLHTAPGRAFLACLEPKEQAALVRASQDADTQNEPFALEAALELIDEAKKCGYGFRRDGIVSRTSAIAVPIFDHGRPVACVSLMFFTSTMGIGKAEKLYLRRIQETAEAIEASSI